MSCKAAFKWRRNSDCCVFLQAVTNILFAGLAAGGGTLISGLLVLPTLARDEMRNEVEGLVRGLGQSLSGYASHMFVPDQPLAQGQNVDNISRRSLIRQRMQEEVVDDEEYRYVASSPALPTQHKMQPAVKFHLVLDRMCMPGCYASQIRVSQHFLNGPGIYPLVCLLASLLRALQLHGFAPSGMFK